MKALNIDGCHFEKVYKISTTNTTLLHLDFENMVK